MPESPELAHDSTQNIPPLEPDTETIPAVATSAVPPRGSAVPPPQSGLLALLACARDCPEGAFADIYKHLSQTLTMLENQAFLIKAGALDAELAALTGPFIARSIIEATCTALIGRFDPFRILMIREKQLLQDYDYSERNSVAMNWNADFHSEVKPNASVTVDSRIDAIPRSLFGKFYEKALWIEAFEKYVDADKTPRADWMIELDKTVPGQFIPNMRQEIQRLYSRCSKAIHQEFVVKNADYADQRFIREQLGQSLELMSKLCVIFGCSPHVLHPVSQTALFESFQLLNERWSN